MVNCMNFKDFQKCLLHKVTIFFFFLIEVCINRICFLEPGSLNKHYFVKEHRVIQAGTEKAHAIGNPSLEYYLYPNIFMLGK